MIGLIGWLGAALLALCGAPEAYSAIVTGTTGVTDGLLIMWGLGEVFTLIYVWSKHRKNGVLPLFFNYGLNIIFISILMWFKWRAYV